MALVLPTVTLTVASRAEAQITQLPSWAVTEFKDLKGTNAFKYGTVAADAVASELAKTNRYDVVPQESVKRSIETLGLSSPPDGLVNLSRIGQDVRASTIVQGEILDYQVKATGGGKQAIVAVRLVAYDVSSGLPVNGALERGQSTIRSGNVTNDVLVSDAIQQAAALAVRTMQGQQLPTATVLNTTTRNALINQGTRSGFKSGDTVIITRGNLQVGTGRIGQVEPDQAEMSVERVQLGLAPGDHVRAVFSPPALPTGDIFTNNGAIRASSKPRGRSNNATLISALLVVGLVAVLLGSGGNSNSTSATAGVTAQATLDGGLPAIQISWRPNGFFKGSGTSGNGVDRWQIYRSGTSASNPVLVIGNRSTVVDSSRQDNSDFPTDVFRGGPNASGQIGGTTCDVTSPVNATRTAETLLAPGTPYVYQVEAVYHVSSLDLPDGTTGSQTSSTGTTASTSGSTSGTTTSGTTTGGSTTGGTTSTSSGSQTTSTAGSTGTTSTAGSTSGTTSGTVELCYFQSGRSASGQATALARPDNLASSGQGGTSTTVSTLFTFTSTQGLGSSAGAQQVPQMFVIEFSDDPTFTSKYTVAQESTIPNTFQFSVNTTGDAFKKKGRSGALLSATTVLYYRVGARVVGDRPGPLPDSASGRRYIYSQFATFRRPSTGTPGTP